MRFFFAGFTAQVPVVYRGVEDRPEHDVHLVDAVGRERVSFAIFVAAAVGFEVAVVARDAGGGELVEPDRAELGPDVVADDLLVPRDRGRRELEPCHPLIRIGAHGRHLVAELLVLLALLQRLLQGIVRLVGAGEPGAGEPA